MILVIEYYYANKKPHKKNKIKNCILAWKKDNTFCTSEKVSCLPYKKRDFIEKTLLKIKN